MDDVQLGGARVLYLREARLAKLGAEGELVRLPYEIPKENIKNNQAASKCAVSLTQV